MTEIKMNSFEFDGKEYILMDDLICSSLFTISLVDFKKIPHRYKLIIIDKNSNPILYNNYVISNTDKKLTCRIPAGSFAIAKELLQVMVDDFLSKLGDIGWKNRIAAMTS